MASLSAVVSATTVGSGQATRPRTFASNNTSEIGLRGVPDYISRLSRLEAGR